MTEAAAIPQSRVMALLRRRHWLLAALMAAALVPVFRRAGLPLQIDLAGMAGAYWLGTTARAIFVAVLLAVLGLPGELTFRPVMRHYRDQKARLLILLAFACLMVPLFGWSLAFVLVVDTIAVAEMLDRDPDRFGARILDVLIPSAYLFFVVVMVFAYNHAVAGMKFAGSWDPFFNRLDARVFGVTVTQTAAWFHARLPQWVYPLVEYSYFSLYAQVGAALVVSAVCAGRREAIRYVATLMTGYVMALAIFYFLPTIGPFTLQSSPHYPESPSTVITQKVILAKAQLLLSRRAAIPEILQVNLADYYIGFPAMHVALPLIAIWFLRRWRRMALLLLAFDVLLVAAMVLLEWHYFLDLLGGVAVAAVAIKLNPPSRAGLGPREVQSAPVVHA